MSVHVDTLRTLLDVFYNKKFQTNEHGVLTEISEQRKIICFIETTILLKRSNLILQLNFMS